MRHGTTLLAQADDDTSVDRTDTAGEQQGHRSVEAAASAGSDGDAHHVNPHRSPPPTPQDDVHAAVSVSTSHDASDKAQHADASLSANVSTQPDDEASHAVDT